MTQDIDPARAFGELAPTRYLLSRDDRLHGRTGGPGLIVSTATATATGPGMTRAGTVELKIPKLGRGATSRAPGAAADGRNIAGASDPRPDKGVSKPAGRRIQAMGMGRCSRSPGVWARSTIRSTCFLDRSVEGDWPFCGSTQPMTPRPGGIVSRPWPSTIEVWAWRRASEAEAFWTEFRARWPGGAAWREAVDLRRPQGSEGRPSTRIRCWQSCRVTRCATCFHAMVRLRSPPPCPGGRT